MKTDGYDISVIIPLYKGQRYCSRLLSMIEDNCRYQQLSNTCSVELLLVNDYPQENIYFEKEGWSFDVELIDQEENCGIHASRVKGINETSGKYIIMLDQDDLVTENWLHSQWNAIQRTDKKYCVCNGWSSRFRPLWSDDSQSVKVNDLNFVLGQGSAIWSPGQVMIERTGIPKAWLNNIQRKNGTDDYLLWILALKSGEEFVLNEEHLYYHTPERTVDSIGAEQMLLSLKEAKDILEKTGSLDICEHELLAKRIKRIEYMECGIKWQPDEDVRFEDLINVNMFPRTKKMLDIMKEWLRFFICGKSIGSYFCNNGYSKVAIYGMGDMGTLLFQELQRTGINVPYVIDRSAKDFKDELPVLRISDELPEVDVIVVTVLQDEGRQIRKELCKAMNCKVVMLEDIFK